MLNPFHRLYKPVTLKPASNTLHLLTLKNKQSQVQLGLRRSADPLFALSEAATPKQPRVCRLYIHLGKDTQRWHFLSAQRYKPGDLSATTRPAVN